MDISTKIDNLIAGLQIIRDKVNRISFYNSSCGFAVFRLSSPLVEAEEVAIKKLGFEYYWDQRAHRGSASYSEY
jgi:hypothetical protein